MKCSKPAKPHGKGESFEVRCRKCMPCRITKKMEWTSRILLENLVHDTAIFVTLTYNPENLPGIDQWPGGTLVKKDLQKFIRALRQHTGRKLRYYGVGEYGTKSQRAHYHAIIYGLSVDDAPAIQHCWPDGFTYVGDLTPQSAQYVARYTTKKISGEQAGDHYHGRTPEFQLSSKRPGLGDGACELIAETLTMDVSRNFILDGCIRMGKKRLPLDAFMKKRIDYYMRDMGHDGLYTMPSERLSSDELKQKRQNSEILATRYVNQSDGKEKI